MSHHPVAQPTPPQPPTQRRSCGCWLVALAAIFIATTLALASLFLPPINLLDRLLALRYTPLNADTPALTFGSELRLSLPTDAATSDFALDVTRLAQDQFEIDAADQPAWLRAARASLPHDLALHGPLYLLDTLGDPPAALQIELLSLDEAASLDRLALYGWDGAVWRFMPTAGGSGITADFVPRALAAFQVTAVAPIVMVTQDIHQDLDPETVGLATILSPAGLRPSQAGGLIGSLAPGGHVDGAYLYMPMIRNYFDVRAIDTATVAGIIGLESLRAGHIAQITNLTHFNGFDGVFIDYRGLTAVHREDFARFISQLSQSLSEHSLLLGMVVPAARSADGAWESQAYDWIALGAAVDYFQLRPTLHPLDFADDRASAVSDILRQVTAAVDRRKVLFGLSAGSLREVDGVQTRISWHDAFAALGDVLVMADEVSETGSVEPGTSIRASLSGYHARLGHDAPARTTYLDYLDETDSAIVRIWFTDAASLRRRLESIAPFAIAGIAFDDLLASHHLGDLTRTLLNFKAGRPGSESPVQLQARWSVEGAGGTLDQIVTDLDAELVLTLDAPDGNYAINWSAIGGDGIESERGGAVVPLFRPTATPTPTPTPTPVPIPVVVAPRDPVTAPSTGISAAPPAAGSISIAIGGHVSGTDSARAIHAMRAAGMTWMKIQAPFDWRSPWDIARDITTAHNNGFKILVGTVGRPAELAQGGQEYIHAYTDWLARIAGQGADAIEVWNEPNLDREWPRGQISGVAYAKMLEIAWNKIKGVNPATMVISAAPAPTGISDIPDRVMPDNQWLRQMVDGGGLNYLDCVGAHYNEGIVPPSQRSGDPRGDNYYTRYFFGMLEGYISITRRPICFTELGYLTSDGLPNLPPYFSWAQNVTLQQQATWLAQAAALASQSGQVPLFIVWNIDFTHYGSDPQAGFAIVRPNGACPACDALANAR